MFTILSKKSLQKQHNRLMGTLFTISLIFLFIHSSVTVLAQDTVQHRTLQEQIIHATAPGIRAEFNTSIIPRSTIQNLQGNGSANNLLDVIPSMITTSDAGTGLGYTYMRVRGIDQTRINVSLNGIAVNDAESQGSWLVNLPDIGTYIDRVDVQRGGQTTTGTVSYGARMDFITREIPENPFAEINSSIGSFSTFHNSISAGTGLINRRLSALATFSDIRSNGYIDRSEAKLNSCFFTAQYKLLNFKKNKDYGTLNFNLLYGTEATGLAWNAVPADSLTTNRTYNSCGEYYTDNGERKYYADEKDHYTQTHYQLSYHKTFGDNNLFWTGKFIATAHLTRGIGYYQQYKDDKKPSKYGLLSLDTLFTTADFITQKYLDNYFYGLHTEYIDYRKLKTQKNQWLSWTIGADIDNYQGQHYGNIIWAQPSHVQDIPADYQWYRGTGNKLQTQLFGSLSYTLEHFRIEGELQYRMMQYKIGGTDDNMLDIDQSYLWNFINPKVNAFYHIAGTIPQNLHLSFSMANREPTRSDIIDAPTDKKPVPETLYDLELGYQIYGKKYNIDVTFYGMYYKDQLVLTGELNDVGAAIMTNVDKSYRAGIEISAAYKPVGFFTWHINGCFSQNRILNFVNHVDNWDDGEQIVENLGNTPISFSPNVVIGNVFTFNPMKNFDIDLTTKFVSKQYLDNSGNDSYCLKPYSYTNLRINYTFHPKFMQDLGIFFQINNLFNTKYESNAWIYSYYTAQVKYSEAGYYPQAGINFLGGIRIKF